MKKNSKTPKRPAAKATAVVATVEPVKAALTDNQAADAIRKQYQVVIRAEAASFRERVRFGGMLLQWEHFLGESRGGAGGTSGEGLKGWLEKNCPEIGYNAAMGYKTMAERAIKMLGGGAAATAALLGESEVTQPDGVVVVVPAKIIEERDHLFEKADSRRKFEQAYFAFMSESGQPEEKKEQKPLPKLTKRDAAKAIWNVFMQKATNRSLKDAIPLLGEKETQTCYDDLRDLVGLLKSHLEEF